MVSLQKPTKFCWWKCINIGYSFGAKPESAVRYFECEISSNKYNPPTIGPCVGYLHIYIKPERGVSYIASASRGRNLARSERHHEEEEEAAAELARLARELKLDITLRSPVVLAAGLHGQTQSGGGGRKTSLPCSRLFRGADPHVARSSSGCWRGEEGGCL